MKNKLLIGFFIATFLCACTSQKKLTAKNSAVSIIPPSGWTANEPRPYKQHVSLRITVHHEGTRLEVKDDATKKDQSNTGMGDGT